MPTASTKPSSPTSKPASRGTQSGPIHPIALDHVFGFSNQLPRTVHVVASPRGVTGDDPNSGNPPRTATPTTPRPTSEMPSILVPAANSGLILSPPPPGGGGARQASLQAHAHPITATAASRDGRWCATADLGIDAAIVVWEAATGVPVKSIFLARGRSAPASGENEEEAAVPVSVVEGALSIAFSHDARYLAAVGPASAPMDRFDTTSSSASPYPWSLRVWDWTQPTAEAVFEYAVTSTDPVSGAPPRSVRFSPHSSARIVTCSPKGVRAWTWRVAERSDAGRLGSSSSSAGGGGTATARPDGSATGGGPDRGPMDPMRVIPADDDVHGVAHYERALGVNNKTAVLTTAAFFGGGVAGGPEMVVAGTTGGDLAVWTRGGAMVAVGKSLPAVAAAVQADGEWGLVKTHHHVHASAIHVVEPLESGILVTGGEDGCVRFFDRTFRLVTFYEKLKAGPIRSISFAHPGRFLIKPEVPSLVIATSLKIVHVSRPARDPSGDIYSELIYEGFPALKTATGGKRDGSPTSMATDPDEAQASMTGSVTCIAAHPMRPVLAVAMDAGGPMVLWNYERREIESVLALTDAATALVVARVPASAGDMALSGDGEARGMVVAGSARGSVRIMGDELEDLADPVVASARAITRIEVAPDGEWIAAADAKCAVAVLRRRPGPGVQYELAGRIQGHHAPVVGLWFLGASNDTPAPPQFGRWRLLSIGQDRQLIEYALSSSSSPSSGTTTDVTDPGDASSLPRVSPLSLVSTRRLEQSLVPTAIAHVRQPLPGSSSSSSSKPVTPPSPTHQNATPTTAASDGLADTETVEQILVAMDGFRIKTFTAASMVGRDSVLAGLFARDPMRWMAPVGRGEGSVPRHLFFATENKLVGLMALPYDGNPHKCLGAVAHPDSITAAAVSYDGKHAFTAGGTSHGCDPSSIDVLSASPTIKVWRLYPSVLDQHAKRASASVPVPQSMDPGTPAPNNASHDMAAFRYLINPTGDRGVQRRLEDLFYYGQIREQGESVPGTRHRLRDTLGVSVLPDMMRALGHFPSEHDVQQMLSMVQLRALENAKEEGVSLDEMVKLFLNYRDAVPLGTDQVSGAVQAIESSSGAVGDLESFLMTYGEAMTADELRHARELGLLDEIATSSSAASNL
ncbi:hypothetical protein BC828DRAFT_388284 [Blastocladiella britannica]|nr:hypothetical protein BC828DRAFT_388284 [Blastocladiella britannica]